jgi:carboxyl-terminal processing protease
MCRSVCLIALLLLTVQPLAASEPVLEEPQRELLLQSFDQVWTTIRDKHWDPDMGGLDWEGLRAELRPDVEKASTVDEARAVMRDLIQRLGQSHFGIIPHEVYDELAGLAGEGARDGTTGLDVRVIDGVALVTSVRPGTPAARAGVQPGWVVAAVGDQEIPDWLEEIAAEIGESPNLDAILSSVVLGRIAGPVGVEIPVAFLDAEDRRVEHTFTLVLERGRRVQLGYLPSLPVWIETKRLDGDVGYITFNMFVDPVQIMTEFNDAMESYLDAAGVVIDLRGNPGGLPHMAVGMSGWLIGEKGRSLGVFSTRETQVSLVVPPRIRTFDGPVAVLVDELSGSCSELLSGGLQGLGRARVFGTRTMGAALPSKIERLPNGDGFQYAFADFVATGGRRLEGVGVEPDVAAPHSREALLAGSDVALDAALDWITGERRVSRASDLLNH